MAQSKSTKKIFNMAYGIGAAIVIVGALFKIQHWPYGSLILTIGMVVEAIVFFISAFDAVEEDLDWTKVYPELGDADGEGAGVNGMLSQKLDNMLKEAKLDAELMASLGNSIKNFEGAAKSMSPAVNSIEATRKYGEELSLAAAQMESLNSLYKVQLESINRQATINEESIENAGKLKEQMKSLASNLSSLNGVYGGMLSAMNKN